MPKKKAPIRKGALEKTLPLDFLPRAPRKSELTQVRILEAAVKCYASMGFESATFEKIGGVAGVSRPLIIRYFSDRQALLLASIKYIRHLFQKRAVEAMEGEKPGTDELSAYVHSTFDWIEYDHPHAVVWLLFFYHCGLTPEWKELNTQLVRTGEERLKEILERGRSPNPEFRAKQVQLVITGTLISLLTEKPWRDIALIRKTTLELCRHIAALK